MGEGQGQGIAGEEQGFSPIVLFWAWPKMGVRWATRRPSVSCFLLFDIETPRFAVSIRRQADAEISQIDIPMAYVIKMPYKKMKIEVKIQTTEVLGEYIRRPP